MQKSKIEWTDYTWNPIKGLCPVGCWYCYARKMYKRFKWRSEVLLDTICFYPSKPSRIFVCSTFELFHPVVRKKQRDIIFEFIEDCPQHTFQILTKLPHLIDRPMPDNVWLGTTITNPLVEHERAYDLLINTKAKMKFISLEPLLSDYYHSVIPILQFDWIIIGRLTGYGKKYDPNKESLERIAEDCRLEFHTPLFMKNNLKEIWGKPLIQEMPNGD